MASFNQSDCIIPTLEFVYDINTRRGRRAGNMICKSSKSAANVYGAMHLNPYLGDKLEVRYTVSDTSPCEVGEFSLMKF